MNASIISIREEVPSKNYNKILVRFSSIKQVIIKIVVQQMKPKVSPQRQNLSRPNMIVRRCRSNYNLPAKGLVRANSNLPGKKFIRSISNSLTKKLVGAISDQHMKTPVWKKKMN